MADLIETVGECLAPRPAMAPQRLAVPAGAWDCHAHVIGLPSVYPLIEPRHYTPPEITPAAFIGMLDAVGVQYGVLVQVSVHGTDNRRMVEALETYPDRLRGIAVIDPDAPDATLAALKKAGVVGLRLLDMKGGVGTRHLGRLAARCAEMGWYVELCVHADQYVALRPQLLDLKAPFIIDHMGWFSTGPGPGGESFGAVLDLLRNADCWIKYCGYFRLSQQAAPYADIVPFAERILEAAPNRTVWGSDWPHVGIVDPNKMPQVGVLLDAICDGVPDPDLQRCILVENPARLFGVPNLRGQA